MVVPFVDIKSQYILLKKRMDKAIMEVISNTRFIHGPEVTLFEKEFARFSGAAYVISVNSGTDALILGIRALGLPAGSEVIVPVDTFIATALGATENGLKPVFVDCDSQDYGMDLDDLKRKITAKTKAIIVVHPYGQPEKIHEIRHIIKASGQSIHLIEDACQAHGAVYRGKKVGTFGIFSAYSFYPGKNLGAYGDGGAIATNSSVFAKRLRILREYGQKKKYVHDSIGINSRLDTIQAAVLRTKLRHVLGWNKKRQAMARYYSKMLKHVIPEVKTPVMFSDKLSVFHLYVIEVEQRDALLAALGKKRIQALIHYPTPLHLQRAFKQLGYKRGDFPHAERMSDRIISLPIYPELTQRQATYVVDCIKEFYQQKKKK